MCRYAMTIYKQHFACFHCRKTFKRKLLNDLKDSVAGQQKESVEAKCPDCGSYMANMGLDFESPKKDDLKKWKVMEGLFELGETFHSCGCGGPGYRPRNESQMKEYLVRTREEYLNTLEKWKKEVLSKDKEAALGFWSGKITLIDKAIANY